jgi:3-oxoacyl-[acyl-carrier protein] reductase
VKFKDQAVLVTGAARGIGRAIALAFAREGARVLVHYHRNRKAAEKTLKALPGGPHALAQADLGVALDAERVVAEVADRFGRLDVVVNNAGIYELHKVLQATPEAWHDAWQRTIATNLMGPAHVCFRAARYMAAHGGGRIVNISSRGAFRGEPEAPAYGASKAGLNAMSQSLARALAPKKIYVHALAPGWVATDMAAPHLKGPGGAELRAQSPLNRVATPDEIAGAVLFLASPAADFMTGGIVDMNGASYLRS